MKISKLFVAVLVASVFMSGNAFALTVEEEIALLKEDVAKIKETDKGGSISDALGINVEAGGTLILQGTDKINDGSDKGRNDGTYSIDLGFGKEFSNGGSAFIHLEAGAGESLNGNGLQTYSGVNRDAGNSDNFTEVTEFWYEQPLFDNKFTVTFGKLDPTGYFDENEYANDETAQFINSAFRNNAAISFTDNSLGLRMTYSPAELIDITYAYIASEWDSFDMSGFNAVQVNVKPCEGGNYRLLYWASNTEMEKYKDNEKTGGYGIAVSIDQKLSEVFGIFGRFSWQDPSVYEFAAAWSFGAQLNGSIWTRENDKVGLAAGQIIPSKDWLDAEGAVKDDPETQTELYYSFAISENLAVTPALQYIVKPSAGNFTDDDIFVYGIRTQITF
jgi:carbohydrate-selective porin OprB